MQFPSDLDIQGDTEYLKITPCKYRGGKATPDGDSIKLYMPSGLAFTNSQKWNSVDYTPLGKSLLNEASFLLEDNILDTLKKPNVLLEKGRKLGEFAGSSIGPYARQFGAGIGAGALQVLGQAMGVQSNFSQQAITGSVRGEILNPQTELFYEAPQLRGWGLSYMFAPKSKKDEEMMQKIIQYLKMESSAKKNDGNPWLSVPKVFQVEFMKGSSRNKNVPLLKPAALQQIDTVLNPGLDYWASFKSGGPVMIGLNMKFDEIEIVYSDDHKEGNLGY
jgi:hypothetical protein